MEIEFLRIVVDEYHSLKKRILEQDAYKDLSQKAQNLFAYIITEMKVMYTLKSINPFSLDHFCCKFKLTDYYEVTKTETASNSTIMRALEELCQARYWIPLENGEWQCVGWLKDARVSDDGQVNVELYKFVGLGIVGFLNHLPDWDMKLQYSNRLYRFLKLNKISKTTVTVDQIRNELGATALSYNRYSNFRQRILAPAVHEINTCTDIHVDYEKVKRNKNDLSFRVQKKLDFLKPRDASTSQVKSPKKQRPKSLDPQERNVSPVQDVEVLPAQVVHTRRAVDKRSSTPDESEMEDLPF